MTLSELRDALAKVSDEVEMKNIVADSIVETVKPIAVKKQRTKK